MYSSRSALRPIQLFPRTELDAPWNALKPVKETGPYPSSLEYRYTLIELLRADFTLSLAEQLAEFRDTGKMSGKMYHIEILHEIMSTARKSRYRRSLGWRARIKKSKFLENVNWEEEKRLMYGSLVLLSTDKFDTFTYAVVRSGPPSLEIQGVTGVDSCGEFLTHRLDGFEFRSCLMMEAAAYYFPYLLVCKGLKNRRSVPFEEEIVNAVAASPKPKYLSHVSSDSKLLKRLCRDLTASQIEAVQSVLCHRVALVQGPPGTGKTHLGVKLVEILLLLSDKDAPILVITTTKHAVNEFLKRCALFTSKVLHACGTAREGRKQEHIGSLQESYNQCSRMDQIAHMRRAKVIAMTTTRATYMREEMETLGIQIVLVEEAAEALEAHIITSIPSSAEHLILLGDHKQLRPNTAHLDLSSKYKLDLSLMERLVSNGFECPMLLEQRRMRPEIARLVKHIYPDLTNHPSIDCRPDIAGVRKNLYFLTHNNEEEKDPSSPSYYNTFEAEVTVAMLNFLLCREHDPERITVLTTYKKQERKIRDLVRNSGEENDIILLSLVRSNDNGSLGFLKKENRACVALSRARNGLFIVGSVRTLKASGAPVWEQVIAELLDQDCLGRAVPLRCPHGRDFEARDAIQIHEAARGCVMCRVREAERAAQTAAISAHAKLAGVVETLARFRSSEADAMFDGMTKEQAEAKRERLALRLMEATIRATEAKRRLDLYERLLLDGRIDVQVDTLEEVDLRITLEELDLSDD